MTAQHYRELTAKRAALSIGVGSPSRRAISGPSILEAHFACPKFRVAVGIEGGVLSRGRHVRPRGFIDDCEKYNQALRH